ncbi:hypothetical protein CTAYLR_002381 [Chrysophaeum taylorii]|uniref:Uncharacterized protein n=1 Tax=Chrysophaeum taylorii TaxID=2483200 RepID=A0AAD7UG82_9STRA|nr:hypothetical protein CTAYLR_002381 [Chrysophaeum taylorii]
MIITPTSGNDDDAKSAARQIPPDEEEEVDDIEERSTVRELMKCLLIAAIVGVLVVLSEEVGELLLATRSFLRRIPLAWGLPAIVAIGGIRRLTPPIYYAFPFSTLAQLYLLRWGVYATAFVFQATLLADIVWFVPIRHIYSGFMGALVDPNDKTARKYVPRDLLRALRGLDREWAHRIKPGGLRGSATMVALGTAWATDELVTYYFFCTRCALSVPAFAGPWIGILVATLPWAIVRAFAIDIVTANYTSLRKIRRWLLRVPLWLIVLWVVIDSSATIFAHYVHVNLIASAFRGDSDDEEEDSPEIIARERRRARLRAAMREQLVETRSPPDGGDLKNDEDSPPADWESSARIYEYTSAANPSLPPIPVVVHPVELHESGASRVIPFDLRKELGGDEPRTSPNLLASSVFASASRSRRVRSLRRRHSTSFASTTSEHGAVTWATGDLFVVPKTEGEMVHRCTGAELGGAALYRVHDGSLLWSRARASTVQRPHRHNSVALDLAVSAPQGAKVYTLMGRCEIDANGNVVDPILRRDRDDGAVFLSPPDWWWHSLELYARDAPAGSAAPPFS